MGTYEKKNGKWVKTSGGANGATPVRGTDYWTEEDKQEIINEVLAALPASEEESF